MRLGPKQLLWVVDHAFREGGFTFHFGRVLVVIQSSNRIPDPPQWDERKAGSLTLNPKWHNQTNEDV